MENIFEFQRLENGFSIERYIGFNDTEIVIPKTFHGLPIIDFTDKLFENCKKLKKLVIYAEINNIPSSFAKNCSNLKTVILPETVRYIGECAFSCCFRLKDVSCGKNVREIGERAFASSDIVSLSPFFNATHIGESAFASCKGLSIVEIPPRITELPKSCFSNCSNLQAVFLPCQLTSIGDKAFLNCKKLNNILIPKSVTFIGKDIFSIEGVYQPDRRYNPRTYYYKNKKLTIYCYPGSYAQQVFREENNIENAKFYKKEEILEISHQQ